MTQYIDKSAVVAEIENCYNECRKRAKIVDADYWNGHVDAYRAVLTILDDTLEVKEVDLEEEVKYILNQYYYFPEESIDIPTVIRITAKHFFELGTKTQYNSIGFQNIDDILKEKGVDPDSKEAKIIKEAYFVAIDKAFENFKKEE